MHISQRISSWTLIVLAICSGVEAHAQPNALLRRQIGGQPAADAGYPNSAFLHAQDPVVTDSRSSRPKRNLLRRDVMQGRGRAGRFDKRGKKERERKERQAAEKEGGMQVQGAKQEEEREKQLVEAEKLRVRRQKELERHPWRQKVKQYEILEAEAKKRGYPKLELGKYYALKEKARIGPKTTSIIIGNAVAIPVHNYPCRAFHAGRYFLQDANYESDRGPRMSMRFLGIEVDPEWPLPGPEEQSQKTRRMYTFLGPVVPSETTREKLWEKAHLVKKKLDDQDDYKIYRHDRTVHENAWVNAFYDAIKE